jgi:poly(A) polymerase
MTPLQHAAFLADGGRHNQGSDYELWTRILTGRDSTQGLGFLEASGVLRTTFPEVQAMVGFGGQDQGHKDLWGHTLQVVRQAKNRPAIRWAALFHDVGKPVSFSKASGKVTFHQHEYASARLFKEASRRTRLFDSKFEARVHALVRGLGLLEGYSPEWTDSAVRRLHKELGDHFEEVLLLSRADVTSKHAYKRERVHQLMHELGERAAKIAAEDAVVPPLPKGLGTAVSTAFGVPPSKRLGDILKALEARYDAGELEGHKDVEFYVAFLRDHRSEFGV